ncbi:MAG: hypothetical protein ABEJ04_06830 [Halobacteriaceae archaeon]
MASLALEDPCPDPPEWARLERTLLTELGDAVHPVLERYTEADRSLLWPPADDYEGMDAVDDAYESFHNWPLAYALGADRALFDHALAEWEAVTDQFADVPTGTGRPQIVAEYQQGHDWFHQSEGNLLFYHLCLADPGHDVLRERARRFADVYLNDREDVPEVYDEERRLLKCPMNGTSGPAYHNFSAEVPPPMYGAHSETRVPWQYAEWKENYGLPYNDLEDVDEVTDLQDPEKARRMGEAIRDRCARTDTPQNLPVTSLVLNAYLLSGESKYREWVLEYVEAWRERTEDNGGLLPDSVDHDGDIGGALDGRWYGGWYGWTWPHGWHSLGACVVAAAENAALLTGDVDHVEWPASQLDHLAERAREADGDLHVPYRYGRSGPYPVAEGLDPDAEEGWFDYRPAQPDYTTHCWWVRRDDADRERLDRLRAEGPADWEAGLSNDLKDFGGNEYPWVAYLDGEYPDYPTEILRHNLEHVRERVAAVETDDQDPATYGDYYLARRNPVTTEALVQLTTGAPQEVFNGGLPLSTLRHFDPERRRPGLPDGVAALVTDLDPDAATVAFVNLADEPRTVTVQAGGFAEHRFTAVAVDADGEGGRGRERADARTVDVDLAGSSRGTVAFGLDRFARDPTYAFPWNR